MSATDVSAAELQELHRQMVTIREFETEILRASRRGDLADATHLCIGQEAAAAGAMAALEPGDLIALGDVCSTEVLKPGDVMECEVEGIGVLRNPVKAAGRSAFAPLEAILSC